VIGGTPIADCTFLSAEAAAQEHGLQSRIVDSRSPIMGCSWSRSEQVDTSATPNALQAGIPAQRLQRRRRQEEKRMRQLQKLQKRNARKRRRKRGSGSGSGPGGPISLGRGGSIQRRRLSEKTRMHLRFLQSEKRI